MASRSRCSTWLWRRVALGAALASGALLAGCGTVVSEVYRQGAIQNAYQPQVSRSAQSPARGLTLAVPPLAESRRGKREQHTLWKCFVPVLSAQAYWEQPDWLAWEGLVYEQYKPAGRDLAEVLAGELARSGLFAKVEGQARPGAADLVLEGDVRDLTLIQRPHLLGTSVFIGPLLGLLGLPLGSWEATQTLELRLVEAASRRVVCERVFQTRDDGVVAAYYGRDPHRCGYPAEALLRPVVAAFVGDVEKALAEKGEGHWAAIAAARGLPPAAPPEPERPVVVPTPPVARPPTALRGQHWAIVIGVSAYRDPRVPPLRYAASDARAFYDWLVDPKGGRYAPDHVKLLLDKEATGAQLREALFTWSRQAIAEDLLVIYYAGHGSPESPASKDNLFLLPYDTDYEKIAATGFPMWDIETALRRFVRAGQIVIVTDACHAGGVGAEFANLGVRDIKVVINQLNEGLQRLTKAASGVAVLTASGADQLSQEGQQWGGGRGVFTHFLLRGLQGEADYNKDGAVTLGELCPYVSEQVRRATRNAQSPEVSGKFDPALPIGGAPARGTP
ncbi:MAG: hypothetical protein FJ291_19365 [Planctomycetes bacterium]|nr:hypothetical protein [Planctomycetota bacterium]